MNVPADGTYTAYVKYPSVSGASTGSPFTIDTGVPGSIAVTKPVNQTTGAGTWVSLGQFTFAEASTGSISLALAAAGTVVGDAVKLVRDTTGESDTEKKDFAYSYDVNGNLLDIKDSQPASKVSDYLMTYNGLNQVDKVEEKKGSTLLKTSTYTYNENGAPVTRGFDDAADKDDQFASYTYDVRDLVDQVKNGKSATDPAPKITGFTYTSRGETDVETKANGNTVDSDQYLDGLLKQKVEKKSNGTLVSSHVLDYSVNGDKVRDAAKVQNADNHTAYLDNVYAYTYDPRDRIAKVDKKGVSRGVDTDSFAYKEGMWLSLLIPIGGTAKAATMSTRRAAAIARGVERGADAAKAASGVPIGERLFTSRAVGVDSKLLGHSYARGESGVMNRTGSRIKFGWTSSGELGGADFGSTHVPNSIANDLLDVIRGLNGL